MSIFNVQLLFSIRLLPLYPGPFSFWLFYHPLYLKISPSDVLCDLTFYLFLHGYLARNQRSSKYSLYYYLLQIVTLSIKALAWCSILTMLLIETKVYILEGRWLLRFGVIYALLGDTVMLNLIWSVKDFYDRLVFRYNFPLKI